MATPTTVPKKSNSKKPEQRPRQPSFSSGPCPKHPGWSIDRVAARAWLGRSHRAAKPRAQLKEAIDRTARLLGLPGDYRIGIMPASDTGAFEAAMWAMLGARPVDMLVWESFGAGWALDATQQLKLDDCRVIAADYGGLPDLSSVRRDADISFAWNGTTSGARVPNADWIAADREGLVFCDATSAAFAQDIEWAKLDVATFSWQKTLGSEAAHGMLVLSPRAVERLESFTPNRPLPKIFRLTKQGKLIEEIFSGATINTPSMIAVADYITALDWAEEIGGLAELKARADRNFAALQSWIDRTEGIENLVAEPAHRSNTSVCLRFTDPAVDADAILQLTKLLEEEGAAFDIKHHRDAPPGLRVWCGATVETTDIEILCRWLDWGIAQMHPIARTVRNGGGR